MGARTFMDLDKYSLDSPRTSARFWDKVDKDDSSGCWIWTAGLEHGYGRFTVANHRSGRGSVMAYAHAISLHYVGRIRPPGAVIDHLCRNTACVNPDHLEYVTDAENVLRGYRDRQWSQCAQGHDLTVPGAISQWSKQRVCRECARLRSSRSKAKRKQAPNLGVDNYAVRPEAVATGGMS